jgi:hypothetical protein
LENIMKKIIASGIAAAALAVVPGVALAAPAFADPHGFDPQQIHNVLENLGQQAQQGDAQAQAPTQDADAQKAPAQDADQQQAPAQDATNPQQGAVQPVSMTRSFGISFAGLGINNTAEVAEVRGPADRVFGGGHPVVGQKEVGELDYDARPGDLPGIIHVKYNVLDANNAVTDTVDMDMVVVQKGPNTPPKLNLQNVRMQNMTGGVNPLQTHGVRFDSIGNVVDGFFRNA